MKKFYTYLFALIFASTQISAQEQLVEQLVDSAVVLMDKQLYSESMTVLQKAIQKAPKHYRANYELAFLYSMMKEYDKSLSLLKKIENSDKTNDRYYQMLGTIYDYKEMPEMAISTYQQGLSKFPDSGRLHVELGMMYHKSNNIEKALETYEKGILADPMFPSNYFYAGLVLMGSSEPVWGLMYGEIFMNLEPYTNRSRTMSEYMVSTIKENVIQNDTAFVASFTKQSMSINPQSMKLEFKFPFVYQMCFNAAGRNAIEEGLDELGLYSLGFIHTQQVKHGTAYYGKDSSNPLFEYLLKVINAGYIEEYCSLLYKGGFPNDYAEWMIMNKDKYLAFMQWRENHPLSINSKNVFSRLTCSPISLGE